MSTPWQILVVEDNDDDAFFMRRALQATVPDAVAHFVADGQAALDFLLSAGPFAEGKTENLPDIVFLDLKLPYVHGLDVLATIRRAPQLRALPVAALTSSGEERDRSRAEALGVDAYLVKPPTPKMLLDVFARLQTVTP